MDNVKKQRGSFLSAACNEFGYCLFPADREHLLDQKQLSARQFVQAVIAIEGLDLQTCAHFPTLLALYQKHFG
ncbi:hypothetical protein LCL97_19250 [Seohaeicola saemankumensis]|nr:hypothetical protein [Seohaeicola saemankumensis]MCA0872971.1 hypothetical protein [Seohaeicola saemankumensis]